MTSIPITLFNRRTRIDCDPDDQEAIKDFFRYEIPGAEFSEAFRVGEWDGTKTLFQRGRVATGLFLEKRKEIEKVFKLKVKDCRESPQFSKPKLDSSLRPYQIAALEAMIKASNNGGIILAATGAGKTRLAAGYFARLQGTAVFVVDELTLLDQTRRELSAALKEEVGIVGKSKFLPSRITVATIQTLYKHCDDLRFRKWFKALTAMLIDELHVMINRRNIGIVEKVKPLAVFGLTATLETKKPHIHLPAVALAGPVIFQYPLSQGVKEGYLSAGRIVQVLFFDPLHGQGKGYSKPVYKNGRRTLTIIEDGSPIAEYRYHISLNRARNDCIEAIVRGGLKRGRRTVVLVERKAHLRALDKRLTDIYHETLSGDIKSEVRLDAIRDMDAGKLPLILATRVFAKGIDLKTVDLIIDATGLPSANAAMQRYGRGARKAEGKKGLLFVDISDRNNHFADAAASRILSLKATGSEIVKVRWDSELPKSSIKKIFQKTS